MYWKGMRWGMSNGFAIVAEGTTRSVSRVGFVRTTSSVRTLRGCFVAPRAAAHWRTQQDNL